MNEAASNSNATTQTFLINTLRDVSISNQRFRVISKLFALFSLYCWYMYSFNCVVWLACVVQLWTLCFSGVLVADVPMTDCNWSSGLRAGRWLCPLWPQCARWVWPYGRSSRSSTPTFWRSTPSFDVSANKVRITQSNVGVCFQLPNVFINA
jgi:hypothetical protein